MSLIIACLFNEGILISSDSFMFDNDGEIPFKHIEFAQILVSESHGIAMAGVGSYWVLTKAYQYIVEEQKNDFDLIALASKWKSLNDKWRENREQELSEAENTTLRPISDSLMILARQDNLKHIHIIDPNGVLHKTSAFVLSGSGGEWTRRYLDNTKKIFEPSDSLSDCFELIQSCYNVSSHDLYVTGIPTITIVKANKIFDLTDTCRSQWEKCKTNYFDNLLKTIKDR
jgi:hypothetical protein